jgi:hypothetical protein
MANRRMKMVRPSKLFMGFLRYYDSSGMTFEESTQTNTNRTISYADQLGRMLDTPLARAGAKGEAGLRLDQAWLGNRCS